MELIRILGDIHGVLGFIVLTVLTLIFLVPDAFSSKDDDK
jgi:hypothetical protein|nr:MAG TPA: protein of unknown function (DUF4006) [Crassvirales sp.]